jgi:two-component system sensor histidine kinase KdpD
VEVSARRVGNELLLAVCDRGPGVPPAVAARIFDAFSRGVPGTEPSVRGTGVGLALCRAIARAHGGELGVRGRRGGGACFELRLPVEPAPAGPADDGPGREGP